MLSKILEHLEALVAFDTRNPPRRIGADGIFAYLRAALPGFSHVLTDHGDGAVSLLAVRGAPRRLFNFHVDTVPASEGWSRDPLQLRVEEDRAIGLGACDIKGAAAAMLAAAAQTTGDLALLFSSDEEANDARCVSGFLRTPHGYAQAIVAEPTQARAVVAHRGIVSALAKFAGVAGHGSEARALKDNAVHRAVHWAQRALDHARALEERSFDGLAGIRLNLGRIEGGIKGNVIAPSCELRFGFRPLPSQSAEEVLALLRNLVAPDQLASLESLFRGPSLPAPDGQPADQRVAAAQALADELGVPVGPAVSFWTEASLFSAAGMTAIVYGPGDIAQAHGADEWVALEQLERVSHTYRRAIDA